MMFIFGALFAIGGVLVILSAVYITRQFHRLPPILKFSKESKVTEATETSKGKFSKWRIFLSWVLAATPVIVLGVVAFFEPLTAGVFTLHLAAIMAIIGLIGRIARNQLTWKPVIALVLTIIYISFGWYFAYNVTETDYVYRNGTVFASQDALPSERPNGAIRVAMISDAHLSNSFNGEGFNEYLSEIQRKNPDVFVMVGDIVDEGSKKEDVDKICTGIKKFNAPLGKYFVYGNHDKGFNRPREFDTEEFLNKLKDGGVKILEDESVLVADSFYITGRKDRSDKTRISADQLSKPLDKSKFKLLLDHQPNDYENESKAGFNLVLSGHTHGGQLIPFSIFDTMLGFNDSAYGIKKIDDTNFIVSSGISDWRLHCKTGTQSEFVIIDIYDDITR